MAKDTRQKILATTSLLLERQGYHATGLNQIVKESSTPRGSLYYYFPDGKEELAAEAVKIRIENMVNHLRTSLKHYDDPADAVYGMIMSLSQNMAQNDCCGGAPIAAVALEASNTSERIREACADGYQALQDVWAAKLVMGGFSAEKAAVLASTINASIEGATILSRAQQDSTPLANAALAMKLLVETSTEK